MNDVDALVPTITLLLAGVLALTFTRRARLSPLVGYLAAGMVIGPHGLRLVHESPTTHLLAELGVVFLLFDIGLHFTLSTIWEARRDIFGLGPLQIILCGLAFGVIALAFGHGAQYAVIVGGALALSSTAVVVHTIAERGQRNCPVGLAATAVLIFQDICAIFLLILAASLGPVGSESLEPSLGMSAFLALLKAAVAFIAAMMIGRYAVRPLFQLFLRTRDEEVFTAMALLVVLAAAAATGGAGLSLTLGAFLGGMILSETPYRHLVQTEAKPFRNLLLGFFFITVGMSLDWRVLLEHWAAIFLFLSGMIAVKAFLVAAAARAFGWSVAGSVQLGFLLAQGSEFVFVIVAMPVVREGMGEEIVTLVITGVAASLMLTPSLAAVGSRLARTLERRSTNTVPPTESVAPGVAKPVLVIGMDEVGRSVADALEAQGVPYDAVDGDYDRFLSASADGYPVAFGDPADARLMETLAYGEREAIVFARVPTEAAEAMKSVMHERYPDRARFIAVDGDEAAARLQGAGLRPVVDRSVPRGLDMAAAVLRQLQVDETKIQSWMRRQQERALQGAGGHTAQVVT